MRRKAGCNGKRSGKVRRNREMEGEPGREREEGEMRRRKKTEREEGMALPWLLQ